MELCTANSTNSPISRPSWTRVNPGILVASVGLLVGIAHADGVNSKSDTQSQNLSQERSDAQFGITSIHIKAGDLAGFEALMDRVSQTTQDFELDHSNTIISDHFYVIRSDHPKTLEMIKEMIRNDPSVSALSVDYDQSPVLRQERIRSQMKSLRPAAGNVHGNSVDSNSGVGIRLGSDNQSPRGGAPDPLFGSQWHFVNDLGSDRDNEINPSIYDTMGLSGLGVTVGISSLQLNGHIDTDHTDLVNNFSLSLSQEFDPGLIPDSTPLTGYAGLISAERNNGIAGQGIAPSSTISTFNWGTGSDLIEFQAYDWMNDSIDIKAYQTSSEFDAATGRYNDGAVADYIMDPLENSIRFGRGGMGVVNIFGTGVGFNLLPDPYTFPPAAGDSFSPTDALQGNPNMIADGVTDAFVSGPFYVGGQISNYPPAIDRRSITVNTVSEDGHYDSLSGIGTAVFASVYGGSSNELLSGSQAVSGRGVLTTSPGGSSTDLIPANGLDVFNANMTGTSITAGIVALMLEANPRLKPRDIQHIFFESIQESTRAPSIKWPDFDITRGYYVPNDPLARRYSFWEVNSGLYTGGPVTNQAIRHSDQYGFGVIDAELAISKAATWPGTPRLFVLDTGLRGDIGNGMEVDDFRLPIDIEDAQYAVLSEPDGAIGLDGATVLIPGTPSVFNFCVRENISIEGIIVNLTMEGIGNNDLFIELFSPTGTRSILTMPSTQNFLGTTDNTPGSPPDDENDQIFNSGIFNGVNYAYYQQPFLTWKHWGELAGGVWTVRITDYGVDDANEEGDEPTGMDPGADMVTTLGEIGVPGSNFRDQKKLTAFRIQIYGTETGVPIFDGCNPLATSCPADLDGNGVINVADLQIFINWFLTGNALADLNGDGSVTYSDLFLFRGLWVPGFCDDNGNPFGGGRPAPGGASGGDNDPVIRPI